VLEVLGRATVVHASTGGRVLVATPDAPRPGTDGDRAMRTAAASVGVDLVVLGDPGTPRALARRCQGSHGATPGV
jgi:hypothetical protein